MTDVVFQEENSECCWQKSALNSYISTPAKWKIPSEETKDRGVFVDIVTTDCVILSIFSTKKRYFRDGVWVRNSARVGLDAVLDPLSSTSHCAAKRNTDYFFTIWKRSLLDRAQQKNCTHHLVMQKTTW